MHAVFITGLVSLPNIANPDLLRYVYNSLLVVFIINYSLFSDRGWWSVLFDLGYIYFLPFTYAGRLFWWVTRSSAKSFKSKIIWQNPQLITRPVSIVAPVKTPTASKIDKDDKESAKINVYHRIARLFFKFAILWSVLILTVNSKIFLSLAVFVTALGASRAIFNLWGLFSGTSTWVDKTETVLANKIAELTTQIDRWDGRSNPDVITQAVNSLKLYRSVLNFIADNTNILASWAFTASILISIPFYCYISLLFSCMYFGIAKISGLNFPLQEAFVDSLFMPFAWSALPSNLLIRFVAGLQATSVMIIGYNILFRHIGNRLDRITKVAAKLRDPFRGDTFITKLSQVEGVLSQCNTTSSANSVKG
jgi:hypothetical protein